MLLIPLVSPLDYHESGDVGSASPLSQLQRHVPKFGQPSGYTRMRPLTIVFFKRLAIPINSTPPETLRSYSASSSNATGAILRRPAYRVVRAFRVELLHPIDEDWRPRFWQTYLICSVDSHVVEFDQQHWLWHHVTSGESRPRL